MDLTGRRLCYVLLGLWRDRRPEVMEMQRRGQAARCWFDYFAEEKDIKAFQAFEASKIAYQLVPRQAGGGSGSQLKVILAPSLQEPRSIQSV